MKYKFNDIINQHDGNAVVVAIIDRNLLARRIKLLEIVNEELAHIFYFLEVYMLSAKTVIDVL